MPDARRYVPRLGRQATPATTGGRGRWPTHSDSVVAWGWYVDGVKQACTDLGFASDRAKVGEGFVWLGLKDPTDEDMSKFAKQFDLHELAIEDAIEGHTRSKLEVFDDDVFAVVSTVAYVDHESVTESSEVVATGQIMVFVCPNYALTVRRGDHAALSGLRARLEADPERLSLGPASVLYGVLDVVVDDYNRVVREFENDVDEIEEAVFSRQGTREIDRVYQLKRELIEFKRSVVPLTSPLAALSTRTFPNIPEDARAYFREVADHHTEAREAIASFDEVLTSLLQAGLARASVEDNQDMRKISAVVAILAVPTTIGAVYGMNFVNMPELEWTYAYPVVLVLMFATMLGTYVFFHRKGWL